MGCELLTIGINAMSGASSFSTLITSSLIADFTSMVIEQSGATRDKNAGSNYDKFWDQSATMLLTVLTIMLFDNATDEKEVNIKSLVKLCTEYGEEGSVDDNGIYKIAVGADSNKTIEVAGSDISNGAKVDIWNYGNATAQKFYFEYQEGYYKIIATHTGKSLTVKDNNIKEGIEIVQRDYKGLDGQKWILRDSKKNGWIISPLSNPSLSLTVQGSISNGDKMILSNTRRYLYEKKSKSQAYGF